MMLRAIAVGGGNERRFGFQTGHRLVRKQPDADVHQQEVRAHEACLRVGVGFL